MFNTPNFDEIKEIVQKNLSLPFDEWLEFVCFFKNGGKQGVAGILKIKNTDFKLVFKYSQNFNYLVRHEYSALTALEALSYTPNFCRAYGMISCKINTEHKNTNPFSGTNICFLRDVLLMEYIENTTKFFNYIDSEKIDNNKIYSLVKQVLFCVKLFHSITFTHYDLHTCNIMVKKCDKDLVFLYKDGDNYFSVPSHGVYPIIIDYGYSFSKTMNGNWKWQSMSFTEAGFISDRFDWLSDPKLFMVSCSFDIKECRNDELSKRFRKTVKKILSPLEIEWDSGWDCSTDRSALDYVEKMLDGLNTSSVFYEEYSLACLDIISSLIVLPIKPQKYTYLDESFKGFIEEFTKIEKQIGINHYRMYILQKIVDFARDISQDYVNGDRLNTIRYFRENILKVVDGLVRYCILEIDYEKMFYSLFVLARCMEGIFYDSMKNKVRSKKIENKRMKEKNIEQIYARIEEEIPDEYTYKKKSSFFLFDIINKETSVFSLSDMEKLGQKELLKELNEACTLERGMILGREIEKE